MIFGAALVAPIPLKIFGIRELFPLMNAAAVAVLAMVMMSMRRSEPHVGLLARHVGVYFSWLVVSAWLITIAAPQIEVLQARLISFAALGLHAILPFAAGLLKLTALERWNNLLTGLVLGGAIASVALIAIYFTDPEPSWHIFGQRVPAVLAVSLISLFVSPLMRSAIAAFLIVAGKISAAILGKTRGMILAIVPAALIVVSQTAYRAGPRILVAPLIGLLLAFSISSNMSTIWDRSAIVDRSAPLEAGEFERSLEETNSRLSAYMYSRGLSDESLVIGFLIWDALVSKMFRDGPVTLLVGFGQLGTSFVGERLVVPSGHVVQTYSAHSEYFDQLVRGGLVGLGLFLTLLAASEFRCVALLLARDPTARLGPFYWRSRCSWAPAVWCTKALVTPSSEPCCVYLSAA